MIITGAFFATTAEIVDQKLNVTGGVLDWVATELNRPNLVNLVMLLQSGLEDTEQESYSVNLEIFSPTGPSVTIAGPIQMDAHQGENRFWVTPFYFAFTEYGRHVFAITVDSSNFSLPLTVRPVPQGGSPE